MSNDWDVDSYRTEYESDEHWELRKNFMLAHKDRFSEDEVVCLAQVFTNIELLGCRYPEQTMVKVAELAKGIVETYREKKKNNLKRTFVTASDAANAKVKGPSVIGDIGQDVWPSKKKKTNTVHMSNQSDKTKLDSAKYIFENPSTRLIKYFKSSSGNDCSSHSYSIESTCNTNTNTNTMADIMQPKINLKKLNGPFSDFVLFLYEEHSVNLLIRNVSLNNYKISWNYNTIQDGQTYCSVMLNGSLVATGKGINQKSSRESAAEEAIKLLQNYCYTIKIKAKFSSDGIVGMNALGCSDIEGGSQKRSIGEQIMKLMGWMGGGLGVKQQGIVEPLNMSNHSHREGLGLKSEVSNISEFREKATSYIKLWLQKNTDDDLVFSSEFSNEERKIMHQIAMSLALKSKSYGKNEKRHLVISKKPTPWQIVQELARAGGKSNKYELIIPNTIQNT